MIASWRTIAREIPEAVLIDTSAYSAELDAVDIAVEKSLKAHGSATSLSPFGWGDPVIKDSVVVGVAKRMIAPVVTSEPARVAVAAFQRLYLSRRTGFSGTIQSENFGAFYIILAMNDHLLARRLKLSNQTALDLVQLVNGPPLTNAHRQNFEYLSQVLNQLERFVAPPAPRPLRESLQRLNDVLSIPFSQYPWKKSKPIVPKRFQKACARIQRLLGQE